MMEEGIVKKFKLFALKHPFLFSSLVMVLAVMVEILPVKHIYGIFVGEPFSSYFGDITMRSVLCITLIVMAKYLGLSGTISFARPNKMKNLILVWPFLLLILLNFSDVITGKVVINLTHIGYLFVNIFDALSIGFFEEILVRGFILTLLLYKWGGTKRGIYLAVIGSTIIFGLGHIINFIQNPDLLFATISQIIYATFIGVIFAALVLRIQTLWPTIILHSLFDLAGHITQSDTARVSTSTANIVAVAIVTFPLLLYGLFILRRVKVQNIECLR